MVVFEFTTGGFFKLDTSYGFDLCFLPHLTVVAELDKQLNLEDRMLLRYRPLTQGNQVRADWD